MTVNITSPVGRLVFGSLYKPRTTDYDGNPLVVKTGPNIGQARVDYNFGVAIPKGAEQHWASTEWGAKIWAVGHAAFPSQAQRPDFAWKITDGDSTVPNKKGAIPAKKEGYPGHWVLAFSGSFAPRIFNADGTQQILEPEAVKPGYYVQVNFDVTDNGNPNNSGVYLNHRMIALAGYGEEISFGPDATAVGFGGATLPAGASTTPVAGGFSPAPAPSATPVAPPAPVAVAMPTPHTAILAGPGATPPAPPAPAPVAATPPARVMLPAANGATYEAMIAAGWTDALLVQHGMMAS